MRMPVVLGLLFCFCLMPLSPAWAEEQADNAQSEKAAEQVPQGLGNPRATMGTFLGAMKEVKRGQGDSISKAIETLDLSDLNPMIRNERGTDLAWLLSEVLDRTRLVNLDRVPDRGKGKPYLFHEYGKGKIVIARQADGRWLFSRDSLALLQEIRDEMGDKPLARGIEEAVGRLPFHLKIRRQLPSSLKDDFFLLENWQWFGLLIIAFVGVLADKLFAWVLSTFVRRWKSRREHQEYRSVQDSILRPWGLMAMAIIWWIGLNLLALPEVALLILLVAVKFLAAFSSVWAAYRLVDLLSSVLLVRAQRTESKMDDVLFPLIPKTLKIFITVVGAVFIADNMNIDVTSLLAGLGLAGMAFALAAKDMVQNLFGSITVLMDRTFSVGDWIIVDGVEGSVEQIGFRSTRVRTFYNSQITVPNSKFITASVDNMGRRRYRRLSTKLGLTYETSPDKVEAFCEGVRELVRQHPYMRKDYFHVYFNGYGSSSLEILLYVFWETPDWSTELRERHRFLLDILRLAQQLGVEFAYPTQTLYMANSGEGNAERNEMAQSEAFELGQGAAKSIVESTTGIGFKQPPVTF